MPIKDRRLWDKAVIRRPSTIGKRPARSLPDSPRLPPAGGCPGHVRQLSSLMADPPTPRDTMIGFDTPRLHELISRIQDGDGLARDDLIRLILRRLETLAQRMLRGFPGVRRWEDTQDVLQTALMRLMQSLERVRPESTCHFFNLAALHVRRALLDLARQYRNTPFESLPGAGDSTPGPAPKAASVEEDDRIDAWTAFHEAVETLTTEEREVFSLAFYHGWPQARIAELLDVDVRTVRRRWQAACLRLKALVGELPPL